MEVSKIGQRDLVYAYYLFRSNLKSVSSMRLDREPSISQKGTGFMAYRFREAWNRRPEKAFEGPVEVDETYMGGERRNMPKAIPAKMEGRGRVGMTTVVGMKDRKTNRVSAEVVPNTSAKTIQGFVHDRIEPDGQVYTDNASPYQSFENHETVTHSHMEYVRGPVHTNGVESFWSLLKRAHVGTFHKFSEDHLHRYAAEYSGHHNMREKDTLAQMAEVACRMFWRHRYKYPVAVSGQSCEGRA